MTIVLVLYHNHHSIWISLMMTTRCNLFYDDHCAGLVLKWFWSPMQQSGDPLFGFQWNNTHKTIKYDEKKVFNFPLKNLVVLWLAVRNGGTFKSIQWTGGNFSLSCILTEGGREEENIKHFNSSEYQRIFDWTQSQNQNYQTLKETGILLATGDFESVTNSSAP